VAALGDAAGTPLGVLDDASFGQTTLRLDPGDTLVLLTDGILEAQEQDGGRPGTRVVLPLLSRERALPSPALARALCEDVLRRGGARIQDDMTVFVLRNPGGPP
jgi:sigma-B regulation protein RsbU (phosphoserine phosphatase)